MGIEPACRSRVVQVNVLTLKEDVEDENGPKMLYRGVRGVLPNSFWTPDSNGWRGF